MTSMPIGFIGLGRMGSLMAGHLVAAGHPLVGYDAAGNVGRLPNGAVSAASVAEVVSNAKVVLLSLPDGTASTLVCREIVATAKLATTVVVDLSTVGIIAARTCDELLRAIDVAYIDAPVSGGVAGARSGTLSMMVGATEEALDPLKSLLATFAPKCFRVGSSPGQGQAMKLLNNYISAAALVATSEAVLFGSHYGLNPTQMIEVVNASTGRTNASSDKFPKSILPESYDYGFAGALMTKDVRLYLENARAAKTPRPLADGVAEVWRQFNERCPGADFTYIFKYLAEGIA